MIVSGEYNEIVKRNKKVSSYRNKPVTKEKMYEIADYFGLTLTGELDVATVSTGYSIWKVYCNNEGWGRE